MAQSLTAGGNLYIRHINLAETELPNWLRSAISVGDCSLHCRNKVSTIFTKYMSLSMSGGIEIGNVCH